MLEVRGIDAGYGPITVLRGVTLRVDEGEMVAVVGPNGAGKSTLLRGVTGLAELRRGSVHFRGERIDGIPAHAVARRGLAHVLENRALFAPLSVEQNLRMGAYAAGRPNRKGAYDLVYDLFPVLRDRRDQAAGTLSGGEQKMLAIARALMARPSMLLLDEPSAGLAPLVVRRLYEAISELHADGLAVVVVEQNVRVALDVARRAYVLSEGQIKAEGSSDDLKRGHEIQALYLGGATDSTADTDPTKQENTPKET